LKEKRGLTHHKRRNTKRIEAKALKVEKKGNNLGRGVRPWPGRGVER